MNKRHYALILFLCACFTMVAQEETASLDKDNRSGSKSDKDTAREIDISEGMFFMVAPAGFNSRASDIWPRPYGNDLVISSNRKGKKSIGKFFNFYRVKKGGKAARRFRGNLYSRLHDASPAFTQDGQTVYFTRNRENPMLFGKGIQQPTRLSLFKSTKKRKKWGAPEVLPFASTAYSTAHPALNPSGDTLYFVSDMPGGFGGSDIYSVAILADGSYGRPVNLGKEINTADDETSPYLLNDRTLFFASKGHKGMGGYDLFAVNLQNKNGVINLGPQINTSSNEFGLMVEGSDSGYFSSDRNGGGYDIYAFTVKDGIEPAVEQRLEGVVALNDHELEVNDSSVHRGDDFKDLSSLLGSIEGENLVAYLGMEPIHFAFDSADINEESKVFLKKVSEYLKASAVLSIKVIGHTDDMGSPEYNKVLSIKRANNIKIFLREMGVRQPIYAEGMGEMAPVQRCKGCEQKNRRVEIKIKI